MNQRFPAFPLVCKILTALLSASFLGLLPAAAAPDLPARMRGVNIPVQGASPDLPARLAAWKVNTVRITFSVDDKKSAAPAPPGQPLAPYAGSIQTLNAFLPGCRANHIGVIIAPSDIVGRRLDVFWKKADGENVRNNLYDFWTAFATEFKGEPAIIAYDVFNEPNYPHGQSDSWGREMLPKAVAAIRAVNKDIWLVVEPGPFGTPDGFATLPALNDPHVIYSFHQYSPHAYTHQGVGPKNPDKGKFTYPGMLSQYPGEPPQMWDRDAIRKFMQPAIDFAAKNHARMLVGEFGVIRWAPGREQWLADNISLFEELGWDWTFHSVAGWNGWNPTYPPEAPSTETTVDGPLPPPKVLLDGWAKNSP
jgi:endoglucanase